MRHRVTIVGRWEDRGLAKAKAAYVAQRGADQVEARRQAIAALPSKDWRGTTVYRTHCSGDYGKGPHDVWLPERVFWQLVDVHRYLCPFHS